MQLKTSQRGICYVLQHMRQNGVWNTGGPRKNVFDEKEDSSNALHVYGVFKFTKCFGFVTYLESLAEPGEGQCRRGN